MLAISTSQGPSPDDAKNNQRVAQAGGGRARCDEGLPENTTCSASYNDTTKVKPV